MYYEFRMKITMKTAEAAVTAKEILRAQLEKGFDFDENYRYNPAQEMVAALKLCGNEISLPEDFAGYIPEDAKKVGIVLAEKLAASVAGSFTYEVVATSDYDELWIDAQCDGNNLCIETTYYPCGFCETLDCEECGEAIISLEEYEEGKIYVCPECGEEIDLSESYSQLAPEIEKKTICFQ